jgi:hypothetical protein
LIGAFSDSQYQIAWQTEARRKLFIGFANRLSIAFAVGSIFAEALAPLRQWLKEAEADDEGEASE